MDCLGGEIVASAGRGDRHEIHGGASVRGGSCGARSFQKLMPNRMTKTNCKRCCQSWESAAIKSQPSSRRHGADDELVPRRTVRRITDFLGTNDRGTNCGTSAGRDPAFHGATVRAPVALRPGKTQLCQWAIPIAKNSPREAVICI